MNLFAETLKLERKRQSYIITSCQNELSKAPHGSMTMRRRKASDTYYWNVIEVKGGEKRKRQINISDNEQLQVQLANKIILRKRLDMATCNLKAIENLIGKYQSTDITDISKCLGENYQAVFRKARQDAFSKIINAPYRKCTFNPEFHKHDTDCGIMVRSKSEKIIVNTLVAYEIPCYYEQEFEYAGSNFRRIYPDFTIFLPNGEIIIWEHLGLLAHEDYCMENAKKLNVYQQNGFTIGENLILTMDNNKGDLSSARINSIIKDDILPYFGRSRA